jgi:hypothetical protein
VTTGDVDGAGKTGHALRAFAGLAAVGLTGSSESHEPRCAEERSIAPGTGWE